MADDKQPIIIKKVKKGGHGHHGGAWKVAYADFVTAMMAFFLLLWLLNATTEEQKRGIANYFDPVSVSRSDHSGSGGMLGGASIVSPKGVMAQQSSRMNLDAVEGLKPTSEGEKHQGPGKDNSPKDTEKAVQKEDAKEKIQAQNIEVDEKVKEEDNNKKVGVTEDTIDQAYEKLERERFEKAENDLREAIQGSPDLKDLADNLLIEQTPEGLRIQIVDKTKKEMFALGSAEMYGHTKKLLVEVGRVVSKLPNQLEITGHTDSKPFKGGRSSNWELSADRADASRKVLAGAGMPQHRIQEVSGKADREHLVPDDPESPMNRRISITMIKDSILKNKSVGRSSAQAAVKKPASKPIPQPAVPKAEPKVEIPKVIEQEPVQQTPKIVKPAEPVRKKRAADTGPI